MKHVLFIGTLLASAPALAQNQPQPGDNSVQPTSEPAQPASNAMVRVDNPWVVVPAQSPGLGLAEAIKATSKPGEADPLNPSCAGETGDECVRSEQPKR